MARAGREVRVEPHGEVPEEPPTQPELFSLYDEEPGGVRPASLAELPGPQERVQRHTVEQLVQILDVPAPLMVDQLMEILKNDVEQVIKAPKIILLDYTPQRAVPRLQQLVEQLVEAPMVEKAIVARVRDASCQTWLECVGSRRVCWRKLGTLLTRRTPPEGVTAGPGGTQILGKADENTHL